MAEGSCRRKLSLVPLDFLLRGRYLGFTTHTLDRSRYTEFVFELEAKNTRKY